MKRLIAGVFLSSVIVFPALAALEEGDQAPDFTAKASLAGKEFYFSLNEALKKGPVVVYFYPSAYTNGCNIEAHTFAEEKKNFEAVNATIIGVSQDSIERLHDYSADPEYCAGKFPVASDMDGSIAAAYDLNTLNLPPGFEDTRGEVVKHAFTERTTFVITPGNSIAATLSSANDGIGPIDHVDQSLAMVKKIAAGK
jgi:peroxiredoxin Q/BCP